MVNHAHTQRQYRHGRVSLDTLGRIVGNFLFSTLVLASLVLAPFVIHAQEAEIPQNTTTFFLASEDGQTWGVVPISPTVVAVCTTILATSNEIESLTTTPPDPECGLLVLSYSTSTPNEEGEEGVVSGGTIKQTFDYYPYGAKRLNQGSGTEKRQYIGQYYDTATALSYLNARYYDGSRGQFLSQDPSFLDIGAAGFEQNYERTLPRYLYKSREVVDGNVEPRDVHLAQRL